VADGVDLASPDGYPDGAWDKADANLIAAANAAGLMDWSLSVDATIVRAYQHATNTSRSTGGSFALQESDPRAAHENHEKLTWPKKSRSNGLKPLDETQRWRGRVLGFSKQAYYKWLKQPVSAQEAEEAHLIQVPQKLH